MNQAKIGVGQTAALLAVAVSGRYRTEEDSTMRTTDPRVLDQVARPTRVCRFCLVRPAGRGDACEHCLELITRFAAGDPAARFALCAMAKRNVLRSELVALDEAYATQDAAYRERLERKATTSRLHPTGVGRPRKVPQ